MRTLYPELKANDSFHLPVGDGHELYVETSGNPDGLPVVVLHGGPGAGSNPDQRRFFDPNRFHIVLFDQRGAGRSRPHASLKANTTAHLIADIEAIRQHLGIGQWLVFGGSWGSTLALAYGQAHPEKVLGLVLRGIFLGRQEDIHWMVSPRGGSAQVFPDHYKDFLAPLEQDSERLLERYYELLTSDNELARMQAAKAWTLWEGRMCTLMPLADESPYLEPSAALAVGRLECHYFINQCFMKEGQLLNNAHRLAELPVAIVHGRYDMVCKLENALTLAEHLPQARLHIVPAAGHSAMEPGITDGLLRAVEQIYGELKR
ncbi:prolyl aminopeptidase [Gallaecimonas sp. GXIMD4217]|uniref:prolyl aminopeptidase n=1 Tax=Gallaecimonas sp. GXIMD4217 TaxID=3131927 RepID=UPI00311AC5A5